MADAKPPALQAWHLSVHAFRVTKMAGAKPPTPTRAEMALAGERPVPPTSPFPPRGNPLSTFPCAGSYASPGCAT